MFKRPLFLLLAFFAAVALEIAAFAWRWAHVVTLAARW